MVYNGKLLNKSSLAYVKTLTNTYKLPLLCKAGQIPSLAKGGGRHQILKQSNITNASLISNSN